MAIKAKDLRHKAGQLAKRQAEILEKATDKLTPEQELEFDTLHDEEQVLLKQAKKIELVQQASHEEEEEAKEVEKTLKAGDLDPEKKKKAEALALKSYLMTGSVPEELRAIMKPAKAEKDDHSFIQKELKELGFTRAAQQSTTTGSGGYTIPEGFQRELEVAMKAYGGMYENCRILRTSTGNTLDWPTINDFANIAYQLSEAGNAETSATKVTDSRVQFGAYKWTSGLIRLSYEIVEDSAFDMVSEVNKLLGTRMGRGINHAATIGTGTQTIQGVTVGASYGASFAAGGAPTYNEMVDLESGLDPAYRRNAKFMFHDRTLKVLKKLKDSQNMPIWLPSARDGAPATFLGYEYIINQDVTWGATNSAKIALFGDFSKYIIRQVNDMRMVRLNERFGDTDEIALGIFFRWDGKVLDAGGKPIVYGRNDAT